MTSKTTLLMLQLLITAISCAPSAGETSGESTVASSVVVIGRTRPAIVIDNRAAAIALADVALSINHVGQRFIAGPAASAMASTSNGSSMLTLLVSCALRASTSLVVNELEYQGELGLAPGWAHHGIGRRGRGWVSACVFARLNGLDVATPVSLRGPSPALQTSAGERDEWTLEEGAFWGDLFAPADQPMAWFACRGADGGAAVGRVCAEEDPTRPGVTLCGITFAGSCADACERRGKFYRNCHVENDVTSEVITTYVAQ